MNREIIFRGKVINDNEWVEGFLIKTKRSTLIVKEFSDDGISVNIKLGYDVRPETVGQYTGRNDLEESRIFDGDILCDDESGRKFIVVWIEEECSFLLKEIGCDVYENTIDWAAIDEGDFLALYIVGNIHDNPELLEVQR
ncbi:YopX family protein [Acetobacterium paludosum]|nr:YopX family protein [Acetobacterium paludosum]